jgi:hypothetical protein
MGTHGGPVRVLLCATLVRYGSTNRVSSRLQRALAWYAGFLSLGSGIALVSTIVLGVPLTASLALAFVTVAVGFGVLVVRTDAPRRAAIIRLARTGLVAGILATLAYDVSKALLSVADPSPYNPFEAIRIFGELIVGVAAPPAVVWITGTVFHLLNGWSFAIAFTQFLGPIAARSARRGVVLGMVWGLVLETFQLTLFPGWLSIKFIAEFTTISFAGHLIYGATLGMIVHRRLRLPGEEPTTGPGPSAP